MRHNDLTADRLEHVAKTLDMLSKLTRVIYEPIAELRNSGFDTADITIRVTQGGEPVSAEDAQEILDWVGGSEMQDDLRCWAEEMKA